MVLNALPEATSGLQILPTQTHCPVYIFSQSGSGKMFAHYEITLKVLTYTL
jgi:hypothetical protein